MMRKTHSRLAGHLSRSFDITVALAAVVLLAPVFAAVALLIVLEDRGPVLFRQTRIGRHGKPFTILKFRSMRDAGGGSPITAGRDPRVTRVGGWMRALKIDELPQLINVLQGAMSLIGPRPEVPEYVDLDDPLWQRVLQAQPGITDLATLVFRDEEALLASASDPVAHYRSVILPQKLRLNVQYQESRSAMRDLKLLCMTARYSFFPRGFNRERILKSLRARGPAPWNPPSAALKEPAK